MEPKDFDVATDALPEDVRKLFRNCRLIGRRFRLAHVFFGRETIEVATFRAASAPPPGDEPLAEDADAEDAEAVDLENPADIEAAIADSLDDEDEEGADDGDEGDEDDEVETQLSVEPQAAARGPQSPGGSEGTRDE